MSSKSGWWWLHVVRTASIVALMMTATFMVVSTRAAAQSKANVSSDRPNIVLIIADDLGADDWGGAGNARVRTPNLDRLAKAGLSFKNAVLTCSSCSPSRSSIITCRYPHNTDAEQLHWPLPAEQITFVELLKDAGYYTAASGKWHLGEAIKDRFDKVDEASTAGFQLPTETRSEARSEPRSEARSEARSEPRSEARSENEVARKTVMEDKQNASGCANWVKVLKERPRDRPFFMWLAALDPHRDYTPNAIPQPHTAAEVTVPVYLPDTQQVRGDLAMYYDEITRLDSFVGAVLDELAAQQVADNTLVVFMSDNGRPFPRCKTTLYESGIRTPLVMRWPTKIAPQTQTDALVSSIDLGMTFLELAGVGAHGRMQGKSFANVISDPQQPHREFAFAEHNWHDYDALERAVRSPRFKYIANLDAGLPLTPPADVVRSPSYRSMRELRQAGQLAAQQAQCFLVPRASEEFYDLSNDPDELHNLAQDERFVDELGRHRTALAAWRGETQDQKVVRAPDEFDRESGEPLPTRKRPRPSKADLSDR